MRVSIDHKARHARRVVQWTVHEKMTPRERGQDQKGGDEGKRGHSQRRNILSQPRIPKLYQQILTPTHDEAFKRMPLQIPNIPSMARTHLLLPRLTKRPNLDMPIIPARRKLFICRTERDGATCFPVCLERGEVVDLRGKVFEGARVVCREEELARVGVGERVDWVVVCLMGKKGRG
jgi:hypothetical protein